MGTTMARNGAKGTIGAVLVLSAVLGLTGLGCRKSAERTEGATASAQTASFHCPMHPTYVSDKKGECPICGMDLVPIEKGPEAEVAPESGGRRIVFYRSPMDPKVHSEGPAQDSMGMDFIPVYEDEVGDPGVGVAGRVPLTLSPEKRKLLGVRTEEVRIQAVGREIRTVGRVVPDERRVHHVHAKLEGYVEKLFVDFEGRLVVKGEPLLSIYSPDLVATQQELLLALRGQKELARSDVTSVALGGMNLLEASRERLRLWDIRDEDIARLERTGSVRRTLDLYAAQGGYVLKKNVVEGMRVMPQDTLFDIADLSRLWVLADVYEQDLPSIRLGMIARVRVPYRADEEWSGPVTYIAPTVDEKTRTVKVRIDLANPAGVLKPDMYADVFLREDSGMGLVVPDSAVIDTGNRKLVFLELPGGRLEPREVQLGARVPNGRRVIQGLREGDRVVTAANFLLDSESSLKAALAAMSERSGPAAAPAASPTSHEH